MAKSYWLPLRLHHYPIPLVDCTALLGIAVADADAVVLANYDHIEGMSLGHTREASLAVANSEGLGSIVPMQLNGCMLSLGIVVVVVLVLVEGEVAVGSGVDANLDRVGGLFGRPLHRRPHGNDRACSNVERQLRKRSVWLDVLAAFDLRAGPEVVPCRLGQIHAAAGCALRRDRADEDRRPEEILIARVLRFEIIAPVHHQGAHQR